MNIRTLSVLIETIIKVNGMFFFLYIKRKQVDGFVHYKKQQHFNVKIVHK